MSTCKICNKSYRTGRIAFIMADGALKGARVCQTCAKNGVLLVAANAATRCTCGKPATRCKACGHRDDVKEKTSGPVTEILKRLKGLLKAYEIAEVEPYNMGKIDGLNSAIVLIESGRW